MHLYINMVKKIIIGWVVGVVAFFVLWALLAKATQYISNKRRHNDPSSEETDEEIEDTDHQS